MASETVMLGLGHLELGIQLLLRIVCCPFKGRSFFCVFTLVGNQIVNKR